MSGLRVAAALAGLLLLPACGSGARSAVPGRATPPVAAPSPAPTAPPVTFRGPIPALPGALVRFGPGADMPALDIDPAGRAELFDGWLGDWYRLAGSRGWVSSASVRGGPPPGTPQTAWTRPASLPAPTAGLLDIALDLQDQRAT